MTSPRPVRGFSQVLQPRHCPRLGDTQLRCVFLIALAASCTRCIPLPVPSAASAERPHEGCKATVPPARCSLCCMCGALAITERRTWWCRLVAFCAAACRFRLSSHCQLPVFSLPQFSVCAVSFRSRAGCRSACCVVSPHRWCSQSCLERRRRVRACFTSAHSQPLWHNIEQSPLSLTFVALRARSGCNSCSG